MFLYTLIWTIIFGVVATGFASPVLVLALWPAFVMAGGTKRQFIAMIGWCFLMLLIWSTAYLIGFMLLEIINDELLVFSLPLGIIWFGAAGALCGVIANRSAALPKVRPYCTAAGGVFGGVLGASWILADQFGFHESFIIATLLWFVLPIGAYYGSAVLQRRGLKRYYRADCVKCGYGDGSKCETCSECGESPMILCSRCRRFSDRKPGKACPVCSATLGRRCWRCQYDWAGIETDRCPECGIWKPVKMGGDTGGAGNPA